MFLLLPNYAPFYSQLTIPKPPILTLLLNISTTLKKIETYLITAAISILLYQLFPKALINVISNFFTTKNNHNIIWIISLLLENGFSLKNTLSIIQLQPKHPDYSSLKKIKKDLYKTGKLSHTLSTTLNLSQSDQTLLKQSEKSNTLTHSLTKINENLIAKETQHQLTKISLLSPILIILLSIIIIGMLYITFIPLLSSMEHLL